MPYGWNKPSVVMISGFGEAPPFASPRGILPAFHTSLKGHVNHISPMRLRAQNVRIYQIHGVKMRIAEAERTTFGNQILGPPVCYYVLDADRCGTGI